MTVNLERVQLLVDALESGAFQQTRDSLVKDFGEDDLRYCCLGVACEVAIDNGLKGLILEAEHEGYRHADFSLESVESSVLPSLVANWYGFGDNNPTLFTSDKGLEEGNHAEEATVLNDELKLNFVEIAAAFRRTYLGGREEEDLDG